MKVHWWPNATLALLNMPREDAENVDRGVALWASSGEGIVIASEGGVFRRPTSTRASQLLRQN
jgi:hypothetical protein